ncbi:MAG: hypothetical protein K2Y39_06730 [Candidatus Obscuribacterales bacterium]|nr:hypothetical protein [Candidatus Obscuribacterales bacterium]
MEKFIHILLATLLLAMGLFLGLLPASAVDGGSSSVLLWGIVTAGAMGALGYWLTFMAADMETNRPHRVATIGAIIMFGATMWFPADTLINGHRYAAYARTIAPIVKAYVIEHFDEVDANRDGIITDGEMESALNRLPLTGEQRQALEFMRANQSEAGHVIDSYTTTTYVWISTGPNGAGYMSPVITTTYVYGVSRGDLEHYPERVIKKWKEW